MITLDFGNHHEAGHPGAIAAQLAGAGGLFGMAAKLASMGLDWPTLAALAGGLAMLLNASVAVAREIRAWRRPEMPK